jgi:hypothetical protein
MEALGSRLYSVCETIRILPQHIHWRDSKHRNYRPEQLGALRSIYRKQSHCQFCRLVTDVINDHLATAYIERMCQDDENEEFMCDLVWMLIGSVESFSPQGEGDEEICGDIYNLSILIMYKDHRKKLLTSLLMPIAGNTAQRSNVLYNQFIF